MTLMTWDQRCFDATNMIVRFIKEFSKDVLSGQGSEEDVMYADFYFDELITDYDMAVVGRDYYILDAEMYLPKSFKG